MYVLAILLVCPIFLVGADYSSNVIRKSNGEVYIRGIRPIKQEGPACYISSASMLLNYYGYNLNVKTLKKKKARTMSIRNVNYANAQLKSRGLQILPLPRNSISEFSSSIMNSINNGLPLWWGCNLSLAPASDKRIKEWAKGGHRRLITGYVVNRDNQVCEIFYSDSWGTEHINKRMTLYAAYRMTPKGDHELQLVYPNDLDPNILKAILPDEKSKVAQGAENELMSKQEVNTSPINKRPLPTWRKRQLETDRMADEILAKEAEKKGK